MPSVTQRIKQIKQPKGGYVKPSLFEVFKIDDGRVLTENENVSSVVVGLTVDYLTRFAMGAKSSEAFEISCMGAEIAEKYLGEKKKIKQARILLEGIKGLDETSIINACKLVTFDGYYRAGTVWLYPDETNPDNETVQNIKIMVQRSLAFFESYGPLVQDGFSFEPNGYTETVNAGDGDFLTPDTLWDFKVSKKKPTSAHTLQLLMYWIMGRHSGQKIYRNIRNLGIFNPRLNEVYMLDVNTVSKKIIEEVEKDVICY